MIAIIIRNTVGVKDLFIPGVTFTAKEILKWGIILLGFRLNYITLSQLGLPVLFMIVFIVISGQLLAFFIGKGFGVNKKLSLLMGVGSTVCGASAIAAIAPIMKSEERDTTLSIAVISLLESIGVIMFTFFAFIAPLSDTAFGIWTGTTLQGVAHAMAAAYARSPIAGEIGTLVKMARVTLLAPIALFYSFHFKGEHQGSGYQFKFPRYVLIFIFVGVIASLNSLYQFIPVALHFGEIEVNLLAQFSLLSKWFILMAIVAIGLQTDIKAFKNTALQALLTCSMVFISIIMISLGLLKIFRL